jgi:hypothetical protein
MYSDTEFGQCLTVEEMDTYGTLASFVSLNEGPAKGMEITIVLDSLIDYVAHEVAAKFASFF